MSLNIFGLEISYYGLLISIGFLVAFLLAMYYTKKKGYKKDMPVDLILLIFPLSIIGARTYYCIFSERSYTFLEYLKIWEGGIAIYGGIIGGLIAIIIYTAVNKISLLKVLDLAAPCLIIGQAIGRIGCYTAGCCYGIPVEIESLQWFPMAVKIYGTWHYSTFFYESFACFIGFIALHLLYTKTPKKLEEKIKNDGFIASCYLIYYGVVRFFIEWIRGDSLYIGVLKVSQLLSLFVVISGILIMLYSLNIIKLPKKQK